jgi:hypothetical protein
MNSIFGFFIKYWQWFVSGIFACVVGGFQLRLWLHQTRESRLKIQELESKLQEAKRLGAMNGGLQNGVAAKPSFDGFSYQQIILDSWELVVVLNDGRSWVDTNREHLKARFADPRKTTKFCFIHPDSSYVDILIQKNGKRRSAQVDEIVRSVQVIHENKLPSCDVETFLHKRPTPYCLFLTEKLAIVHPYLFFEAGALPMFTYLSDTPFYAIYREDAQKLLKESPSIDAVQIIKKYKSK